MRPEGNRASQLFDAPTRAAVERRYTPRPAHEHYTFAPSDYLDASSTCRVFKAINKETGEQVALKFVAPPLTHDIPDKVQGYAIRELDLSRDKIPLIESPYILKPTDVVSDEILGIGLVIPWAKGGTVAEHREELDATSWESSASYGIQVALGLAALHEHGIIYRDLKPENIFIKSTENIPFAPCAIGDFGISATTDYLQKRKGKAVWDSTHIREALLDEDPKNKIWEKDRLTPVGIIMGTAEQLSPEQARGHTLTPSSDLFSLGTLLFELADGELPFDGDTTDEAMQNICRQEPRTLDNTEQHYQKATKDMKQVIYALLIKEVQERGHVHTSFSQNEIVAFLRSLLSIQPKTIHMQTARDVAKALAQCWQGSGSPIEKTPWFKEALGTK